jgi:hypothetical protein
VLGQPISAVRACRPHSRRPVRSRQAACRGRSAPARRRSRLATPPFGPGAAYREVCRVVRARGEQPPGYHTIYGLIRAIPEDLKTLALGWREGLSRGLRPGSSPRGRTAEPDLAGRPYATRSLGQTCRRHVGAAVADCRDRRPQPRDCQLFHLVREPVGRTNCSHSPPGDLAEIGRSLDRLRHSRDFLHR